MQKAKVEVDSFTDELLVESLGKLWRLARPYNFYYEINSVRIHVVVPKGFLTDFASTPKILYPIFPPVGIYNKATMLHDYLYDITCTLNITRKQADQFLLQALEVLGVSFLKRWLMYLGIRLGGASHFREQITS